MDAQKNGADSSRLEAHVSIESPVCCPVELLQAASGLSRQRIKISMTQGAVWLTRGRNTRRLRRATRTLRVGDQLHLYYDARIMAERPPEPTLIADLGKYSVWRKPYGLRSQGSKWGDHCSLVRWVERNLRPERSAFTVHRLDRAANGLMLVAHAKSTAAELARLFRRREIEKRYIAVVAGDFSHCSSPVRIAQPIDGKVAVSEFSLQQVSRDRRQSLLDVRIETGRKHQIRIHLAGLGYPVVGDRLHGSAAADEVDLQLAAYYLAFHCPVDDQHVAYRLNDEWLPGVS